MSEETAPIDHSDEADDRTTGDLLIALGSDFERCYEHLLKRLDEGERFPDGTVSADDQFEARQLVRAAFAYIEGAVHVLKVDSSLRADENSVVLLPQEQHFIFECDFDLNEKGEVVEKPAKIPLAKNIRFAFSIFAKAAKSDYVFDANAKWWSQLKEAIRIRDRLMHPRWSSDLDVSPRELIAVIDAKHGLDEVLHALVKAEGASK
jgi:hypothetical protein